MASLNRIQIMNLKLERHQRVHPTKLLFVSLIITVLLTSLSQLRDLQYPKCSSYFVDTDVAITLLQVLVLSPAVVSTSLSSQQSYGLFNDIPDQRWELMRKRAHEEHASVQTDLSFMPKIRHDNPIIEYLSNLEPDFNCPHENRVGGLGVGRMWTCNAHRLLGRKECLIYSFGSDGSYTWEDGLVDLLGSWHCEIHVFDPADHERTGDDILMNIHYHKWNLKSSYHDMFNAALTWNARRDDAPYSFTFQEILDKLGHQERTIDILRMDCGKTGLTEWTTYHDWLKADIRQIVLSTHGVPFFVGTEVDYLQVLGGDFFAAFTSRHYAMFSKEATEDGFDFGYVKLHPDFWTSGGQDSTALRQYFLPKRFDPAPDPAFRIPRRLVFVHEKNVMMTEDPVELFFNAWNTIETYKKAWDVSDVQTWSVDSFTCLAILYTEKVELLPYYRAETNPARKTAVCSVAAMYLSGGFYFDMGLEVGSPYVPTDDVSLVVARDGDGLSSQFMACEPRSSVVEMTLERMLASYKRNQTHPDFEHGSLLEESIAALKAMVRHEIVSLKVIGGEISTPWIQSEPPIHAFDNPVPLEMREPPSPDFKIPRRLLFTYKSNLLETKEPPLFYENVQKTIRIYREAWGEPDAPVWFLDDDDCRAAIYAAKPNLVTYFDREIDVSWKADICRVAALHLTGGYYFDIDMEAVNPWIPSGNVTFATVNSPGHSGFFQSFLASEKKGRVIEEALNEMLVFYEERKPRIKMLLGVATLKWAFESVPPSELGETVILEEINYSLKDSEISSRRREAVGCCCRFKVQEPVSSLTIFYSRIVGESSKCTDPSSSAGQAWAAGNPSKE